MGKRTKWSSSAKFEIALKVIKGDLTLNEVCKRHEVSPSQVHAWKKQLREEGAEVFKKVDKSKQIIEAHQRQEKELFEKIGQLTMERDFLKKAWSKLHEENV